MVGLCSQETWRATHLMPGSRLICDWQLCEVKGEIPKLVCAQRKPPHIKPGSLCLLLIQEVWACALCEMEV